MKGATMTRSVVLMALLIGSRIEATAQGDVQRFLEQGRDLYYKAQFAEAVRVLSAADKLVDSLTPKADAASVKTYLAVSYFALRENESATKTFAGICKVDPDYSIGVGEFNPSIVALFQQANKRCIAEKCDANCSSLILAAQSRDPDQIQKAAKTDANCDCDARKMAAQAMLEIASDNYKKKQYRLARDQFQAVVELDPSLRAQVPGLGSMRVTGIGIGGRLFVDGEFQTAIVAEQPYESPPMPAGTYKLRLEPNNVGSSPVQETVNIPADSTAPVFFTLSRGTGGSNRQPIPQTATLRPRALLDLETGTQNGNGVDLMWIEINQIRHLVPQRRTGLALLPRSRSFESITPDELRRQKYTDNLLGTNDKPLSAGTIIAVQTGDGGFAKLRIDSVGASLSVSWIVYQ